MDLYFERHDGQAVTCDDFVQAMEDASVASGGPDLGQFRRWYSQAGTPVVTASGRYDAARAAYTLELAQRTAATPGQPRKAPFHVPFAVGLVGPDGRDQPLRLAGEASAGGTTRVLSLKATRQSFEFVGVGAPPVPSLLRGFSAPVRLEFDYTDAELAFLAAHDTDPFNRWDAAQRSFCRAILAQADAHARGEAMRLPAPLAELAAKTLADDRADPALLALALTPPETTYLASLVETIDVDALVAAREFVVHALAREMRPALEASRAHRAPRAAYAPTPEQIGARMIRNVCLRYLGALDDGPARALAVAQFDAADNMTDAIAALAALNHSVAPEREALFARFEAKWRDEPLVLDKWFALQAASHRADTLARVRSLLAHPGFDARNPNRVRALVATFARRNWSAFHRADASGYAFVGEQVLAFDRRNPQLAAALAGAFSLWRGFAEPRRSLQRAALETIGRSPDLSPDVAEIVERNLAD
jgi:aminopeptidase N